MQASKFDTSRIEWTRIQDAELGYECDYELAVLHASPATGRLDIMVRWQPNAYCHFHRHVADTSVLVIEGEQNILDVADDGTDGKHKVRPAGTYAFSPAGDAHMEYGGPEGATVFFSFHSPDGRVFEILDREMNVLATTTVQDMAEGRILPPA